MLLCLSLWKFHGLLWFRLSVLAVTVLSINSQHVLQSTCVHIYINHLLLSHSLHWIKINERVQYKIFGVVCASVFALVSLICSYAIASALSSL